jgi:1-acyl-sn-glycerol-3-phosphate acyltransferase
MVWGIGRVLMKEQTEVRCRLIDLGRDPDHADVDALARDLSSNTDEEELAIRAGSRFVRRLTRVRSENLPLRVMRTPPLSSSEWRAEIRTPGALQTIQFQAVPPRHPGSGEVAVRIESAGVNFRDVMLAMGTIPGLESEASFGHQYLGLDAAGVVTACGEGVDAFAPGDAVVAIVPGAFSSASVTSAHLVARRPAAISVEEAAAAPCAFVTAHYALNHLARLSSGDRVLIHAATGGVGLAAMQIARRAGATIFATAGSPEKRAWLASMGVPHVMDSRSLAFADEILDATGGEGVDVVLNSLTGEALVRSLAILRPYGRFLEIGKRDIYQDSQLGLLAFRKNLSFFAIDLDRLCAERPRFVGQLLREVMDRLGDGTLEPLPQTVFAMTEVEQALRLMAQAKHIGKIVLSGAGSTPPVSSSALFRDDATYLVTGGLGGFGLTVARWMCAQGARSIALMGRRGASVEQQGILAGLAAEGVHVAVFRGDVAHLPDVRAVVQALRSSGRPLRGVFHAAMVLDDGPLGEMTAERFERVMAPKVAGAWNLHAETIGEGLDHFVMFSSIASLLGNPMQANYSAANAFLDALAHARRHAGLPALTINWGVLAEVGFVARHRDVAEYLDRQGYESFKSDQALDVLGCLMRRDTAQMMAARIDWPQWARSAMTGALSPRLRHLVPSSGSKGAAASDAQRRTVDELGSIADPAARDEWVVRYLRDKVARVLGAAPARIDVDRPLTELGTDSLTAVELTTVLKVDLGVELPLVRVLQGVSTRRLAALVLESLNLPPDRAGAPASPTGGNGAASSGGAPIASDVRGSGESAAVADVPEPPSERSMMSEAQASSNGNGHRREQWSLVQRVARRSISLAFRTLTAVRVEGLEHLPAEGPFVLAVNHLSMMDVPLALVVLPRPAVMLAADYLRDSRFMNWFLGDLGHAIFVARGAADRPALDRAIEVLRAGGVLALAPEGTRSRTGSLGPGRTGAAYLATETGAPVVPLVAWGQERLVDSWKRLQRPRIQVRVGRPLRLPKGPASPARLREYSDQIMHALAAALPEEYRGVYASK